MEQTISVLAIEDDPGDILLLQEMLGELKHLSLKLDVVNSLQSGIEKLRNETFDVVVLDLSLPDRKGLATFQILYHNAPELPVIIMTDISDEALAFDAIKKGAQDYLVKGRVTAEMLQRCLLSAVERGKLQKQLHSLEGKFRSVNSRLEKLNFQDPMTHLLNRRGLLAVINKELDRAENKESPLTVLVVDLDNFKDINDHLGFAVGDSILKVIVRRLRSCLRGTDYAARVGGDEFMIVLPATHPEYGGQIAEKIRLAIGSSPIGLASGKSIQVTASIGIVRTSLEEVSSIDELLSKSHPALQTSKVSGKNQTTVHIRHRIKHRRGTPSKNALVEKLRRCNRFDVVAQPLYKLSNQTVMGYEFLGRSRIKVFEMPDDFFKVCLENHILTLVDHHFFNACLDAGQDLSPTLVRHVNIFPSTLIDVPVQNLLKGFPPDVPPSSICIELSEQQVLGDIDALLEPIETLKKFGCKIAIDDVGFGRTSLESLIHLNPNSIKIDKSQVTEAWRDSRQHTCLNRILKVADSLGADVVAEGIESKEDLNLLKSLGVRYGQGYLWGKPAALPKLDKQSPRMHVI